jgi:putative FmdB family regulatory protein
MPLYEYECPACEQRFELMRSHQDPPVRTCPSCKSRRIKKLVSAPAFQFKGSGWYITDYADSKSAKGKGSEAGGGSESAASDGGGDSSAGEVTTSSKSDKGGDQSGSDASSSDRAKGSDGAKGSKGEKSKSKGAKKA